MTVFESRGGGGMSAFELVLTSVVHLSCNNVVYFHGFREQFKR